MGKEKDFGFADVLVFLKKGKKLARKGWNGKYMFIFFVEGSEFKVDRAPLNKFYEEGTRIVYRPHIDMKAADGTVGVWLASQTDILANDWFLVE